jgi:hypothetical protein
MKPIRTFNDAISRILDLEDRVVKLEPKASNQPTPPLATSGDIQVGRWYTTMGGEYYVYITERMRDTCLSRPMNTYLYTGHVLRAEDGSEVPRDCESHQWLVSGANTSDQVARDDMALVQTVGHRVAPGHNPNSVLLQGVHPGHRLLTTEENQRTRATTTRSILRWNASQRQWSGSGWWGNNPNDTFCVPFGWQDPALAQPAAESFLPIQAGKLYRTRD